MLPSFSRCLLSLAVGVSIALLAGCAGLADSSVRSTIEPAERTIAFIDTFELDKNQIYDRALSWATQIYTSSKRVIDMKDREAGIISINAIVDVTVAITKLPCNYSLQIRIKDGKTKMTFAINKMDTQYGGYPPKNSMPEIHSYFSAMHGTYVDAVNMQTSADDF